MRQLVDSTGVVGMAEVYEPFGQVITSTGTTLTSYGFTGEWTDSTGLLHLGARYYSPYLNQFIQPDPIVPDPYIPADWNRYTYVRNNSITRTDPSGLITEDEAQKADEIHQRLTRFYNVDLWKDWGYEYVNVGFELPLSCIWRTGNWRNLDELLWTQSAIIDVARKMGGAGKFRAAMRARVSISRWAGENPRSFAPPIGASFIGDVILTDYSFNSDKLFAEFSIAHELGHVWDHRSGHDLSFGLINSLDTWICDSDGCNWYPFARHYDPVTDTFVEPELPPGTMVGCTVNDIIAGRNGCEWPYAATYGMGSLFEGPGWEDWAESFASYVYPTFFTNQGLLGLKEGGIRETYVREKISLIP